MRNVKVFVLCGGKGVRLRPLTYYFQKVMIPIGDSQKPLLEYIITLLKKHGLRDIALLVNYKYSQVKNYFGDGSRFGVNLSYVLDNPGLGGTGGAVLNAYLSGEAEGYEMILVYYGDILSTVNLSEMINYHISNGADLTLAVSEGYKIEVGVVEHANGEIKEIKEKPVLPINVGIGIMSMNTDILELLYNLAKGKSSVDLMGDLLPELINRGMKVMAYVTGGIWYDVGSIERYEKLSQALVKKVEDYLEG